MGKFHKWIFLLLAFFLFQACNSNNNKQISNPWFSIVDTSKHTIDTLLQQVQLDSLKVNLVLFRAKLDEHFHPFDTSIASPVRLAIFKDSFNLPIYLKTFENEPDDYPFVSATIFKANEISIKASGPLFFSLEKGYGGSGSSYQLYLIQAISNEIRLTSLFKGIGELSYPYFLANGKQLLVFESVWNSAQGEAHFSDHHIKITAITISKGIPIIQFIGQSRNKYTLPYNNQMARVLMKDFQMKEPELLLPLNI